MKNKNIILTSIVALLIFGVASITNAQVINSTLSPGARGAEVSKLQSFLATNPLIYPEGLVTGFYGPLTEAAVRQFQVNYDLPQVGIFGPLTQAKMNKVISSGLGLDISAPIISQVAKQANNNSATLSFTTDSYSNGKVYYDTKPLYISDASMRFTAPSVSGSTKGENTLTAFHSINMGDLSPNTTYHYLVQVTDASGNVSVVWPSTFTTN